MRQRITALLLALAVLASVCAVSALAEERPAPADTAQAESPEGEDRPASPETPAEAAPEAAPETAPETEAGAPSLAGPDLAENVTIQPDPWERSASPMWNAGCGRATSSSWPWSRAF